MVSRNEKGVNMSKETKQDRIARNMFDQVAEHLHDLKTLESNPASKELDVERWCQSFLKVCLGYTASTGEMDFEKYIKS